MQAGAAGGLGAGAWGVERAGAGCRMELACACTRLRCSWGQSNGVTARHSSDLVVNPL